jgi:dienelactone hydrolase
LIQRFRVIARLLFLASIAVTANAEPAPLTLADLYSDEDVRDAAVSPSGRYLAVVIRQELIDVVVVHDLETSAQVIPTSINRKGAGPNFEIRISNVYWKSDERILFRVRTRPIAGTKVDKLDRSSFGKLGDRLFAINRDGTKAVRLLAQNGDFVLLGALNLGAIASLLPKDPEHVLMLVDGFVGPAVFRVDINSGMGDLIEFPVENLVGWWSDLDGNPMVRIERSFGEVRFYRKQPDGKWKKFFSMPVQEMRNRPEYELVGPSSDPNKFYVLARPPGHDRIGVYLYDLTQEQFGAPIVENATYDIDSARISRDGTKLLHHCYTVHVRVCEFTDVATNAHMRRLREHFRETANVYVTDASENGQVILAFVEGPSVPPSYYYYRADQKHIELVGFERNVLEDRAIASAAPVNWRARDGRELSGYLTRPPGAAAANKLPLVVMPHGGPELRDQLTFNRWAQFFAARGYAVFQPNFRGSGGFGKSFAESGYGEWGRKMQDDIGDGLQSLIDQSIVDPERVCIVGASYGGYAALAGAALTPDTYRCAASIAGVTDLSALVKWYKFEHGPESEGSQYLMRLIGDPERSLQRMREVSPVHLAGAIKADVLLVHGDKDDIVPFSQSVAMKKALEKQGHKTTLLVLEKEGHSFWTDDDEMRMLRAVDALLWKNLGPGFGVTTPPEVETHRISTN